MWPEIATSTGASVLSTVGGAFSDPGMLTVISIAAGIPLAFYVIHRVIGLFTHGRAR